MRFAIVFLVALNVSACATLNRNKILLATAGGLSVGAVVGASRPEEKAKNAVLYGSLAGVATAIASTFIFDDSKRVSALEKETAELKRTNQILAQQVSPKLERQGTSMLAAPIPQDLKRLVQPGGWRRYKLDRWVQDENSENVWFRQTEMFEVTLPTISD